MTGILSRYQGDFLEISMEALTLECHMVGSSSSSDITVRKLQFEHCQMHDR